MSSFVKKLMATGAALSIGISSFAVADYYDLNNNCLPPPCDPGCVNWCDNLSFNAAWLYWKASGDDFQYAVEKASSVVASVGTGQDRSVSFEKFHDVKFDWDSGFRIGVGLDLPCKGWGIDVVWTHFDTSSASKLHVQGNDSSDVAVGFPVLNPFPAFDLGSSDSVDFRGAVKLAYNVVDIEFGKWCCCGCVQFRPHAGFRLADIKEHFKDRARGNNNVTFDDVFSFADFHHENSFKGFGVRSGLDVDFCLCDGWSIIGRGAASAIWGTTHLKNRTVLSTPSIVARETNFIKEDFHQTRFITDLSLGLRYRTMACGCYPLTVELAWEHHYLFSQHRYWVDDHYDDFDTTSNWRSTGDMALQGLTLSIGFDY